MARPYHRALLPQVLDDMRALAAFDDTLVDAALQVIVDVAEHRKTGKLLGAATSPAISAAVDGCASTFAANARSGSGSSTGSCPTRTTRTPSEVIAGGPRGGHAGYQAAVARLTSS